MGKNRRVLLVYNLVVYLIAVPVVIYTLWQSIISRDKKYLFQRLGFSYPKLPKKPIWIHAASVGEVNAVLPLISLLQKKPNSPPILITTFTPTGGKFASANVSGDVIHVYLPVDFFGAVKKFLESIKPTCVVVVETEIWLNLYSQCKQRNIPLIIINGRISTRTLNAGQWLRKIYAVALQCPSAILARSEADRVNYIQLGAPSENVRRIGNIKFAYKIKNFNADPIKLSSRSYVLVASTHANEEVDILKAWLSINTGNNLLVIAPRHPKRLSEILHQLSALTDKIAIRSRQNKVNNDTKVYLVDTLGELTEFMPAAKFIFMGGSLAKVGGQNILEPASLGKAIVFGQHMYNFADEAKLLLENDAALLINNVSELAKTFQQLLDSPEQCIHLGENAKKLVAQNQDIAERYLHELAPYVTVIDDTEKN